MKKIICSFLTLNLLLFLTVYGQEKMEASKSQNPFFGTVEVENVKSINSTDLDYSPIYYEDGIIFTSTRSKTSDSNHKKWFKKNPRTAAKKTNSSAYAWIFT